MLTAGRGVLTAEKMDEVIAENQWLFADETTTATGANRGGGPVDENALGVLREAYRWNLNSDDMLAAACPVINSLHPTLMAIGGFIHDGLRSEDEIAEILQHIGEKFGHRAPERKDTVDVAKWVTKRDPVEMEPTRPYFTHSSRLGLYVAETQAELDQVIGKKMREASAADPSFDGGFKFPKVPGKVSDYLLLPRHTAFDGWCGRGRTHIIAGSSGSGKTTLMVPLLRDQWEGKTIFGHVGARLRPLVIFADRGELSNEETLLRLGLTNTSLPICHLSDAVDDIALSEILQMIERQPVLPEVVFVEGADELVSKASESAVVSRFLNGVKKIAGHYHISFIMSLGAPKAKPKDQHGLIRDRVFGSEKWARKSDMILSLMAEGDGTSKDSKLIVQYRNAAAEKFDLTFENGILVERLPRAGNIDPFEVWLANRDGKCFTRPEAAEAMKTSQSGQSPATVYRKIHKMLADGRLKNKPNKKTGIDELWWIQSKQSIEDIALREALTGVFDQEATA